MRFAATIAIAAASSAPSAQSADPLPCHVKRDAAIGCIGDALGAAPENAADFYERFGFDSKRINAANGFIQRYLCLTIRAGIGNGMIKVLGRTVLDGERGAIPILYMRIKVPSDPPRTVLVWSAANYFAGDC